MIILVKNWIFVFLDEIFFSSACSAWKARVATFLVKVKNYYVLSLTPINISEIGQIAKKLQ